MDGIHSKKHELHHVVESEVRKVLRELPPGAYEPGELLNYGYIGLLEAEKRFDPTLGTPLDAFARFRIRGAILDGLRTGLGRFGRSHYQRLRRDYIAHKKENGDCTVTQADVTFREIDRYAETLLKNHPVMPSPNNAEDALAWGQELAVMRQAIEELNTKERRVIRAVYDLSLRDDSGAKLAERLGIHRSQISRKHHAVISRLRAVMRRIRRKTIDP
ncbi:MAG: sigma-70 family RNA polymerase sigma factor [Myxococcota bacterium]|nr:sigma-70 family RNA polymerase sigma factor [Myxococcota bacterium]